MDGLLVILVLFLLGLGLIVKGGDLFVDAAVWMAEASGMPKFLIGATIVSLATTLPELMVSVMGVLRGEVDLAVGNAVGSVTANTGLIMGLSAVCLPAAVRRIKHLNFLSFPVIIDSKNKNAAACGCANTRKPMQVVAHLHNGPRAAPHGL